MPLTHETGFGGWTGQDIHWLSYSPAFQVSASIDATGEKLAYIGRVWHPNGPGTYSVVRAGFRFGNLATKAGGSALTVSLQNVSLTAGPPIQPDEVQDQTVAIANGDAGFAINTWYRTNAFNTPRSVTTGELLALVIEYDANGRLSTDVFRGSALATAGRGASNGYSVAKVGAPAWVLDFSNPGVVFECDDGSFATFYSALPCSAVANTTFGETSTPDEYGMKWTQQLERKIDAARFAYQVSPQNSQFNLYDANDTPLITIDLDLNAFASAGFFPVELIFPSEVTLEAGEIYRAAFKVTSGGATSGGAVTRLTVPDTDFMPLHGWPLGSHETSRTNGGAWNDANTTNLLLGGLHASGSHDGASAGSTIRRHSGGKFQRLA